MCAKLKVNGKIEIAMEMLITEWKKKPEWKEELLYEIGTFLIQYCELDLYF